MNNRPIHARQFDGEQQLSVTRLTPAEAAGDVARDLGLIPARQHQLPRVREVGPSHVCFVHPAEPTRATSTSLLARVA